MLTNSTLLLLLSVPERQNEQKQPKNGRGSRSARFSTLENGRRAPAKKFRTSLTRGRAGQKSTIGSAATAHGPPRAPTTIRRWGVINIRWACRRVLRFPAGSLAATSGRHRP